MKKYLSTALAMLLVVGLAGCGQAQETGSSDGSATQTQETEQTTGSDEGITVAVAAQFTTLDPALNTEMVNDYVIYHLYSGLFRYDADGQPQPELCETYETSDDGLTWTFHLRDAKWSDGSKITADDFVYSYLRVLSYGADNAYNAYDMTSIIEGAQEYNDRALEAGSGFDCTTEDHSGVGIEATDENTFVLRLKSPCTFLPRVLNSMCWLPVTQSTPQHDSLWAMEPGFVTCGPYTLTEINPNEKAVLNKNPQYFNADKITMPEITYQVMTDMDAQLVAFQAGSVDIACDVSLDSAAQYVGTDSMWLQEGPTNYFLAINSGSTGPDWAKDVNVRRALAKAIDKNAIAEILGGVSFYPVLDGYIPYGFPDTNGKDFRDNAPATANGYDLEEAKALLAQAGYDESNPLHITYKYSNNGLHGDVATALQSMWAAAGIDVEFAAVEAGVFYDQLDAGDFEISRYGYTANTSPSKSLELWTTGMQVVAAVDDATYDKKIEEIKAEPDPDRFMEKCHDAENYLYEENVYLIPLFQYNTPSLKNPALNGAEDIMGELFFGHTSWAR